MANSSSKYSISGDAREDRISVLLVMLVPGCCTLHQIRDAQGDVHYPHQSSLSRFPGKFTVGTFYLTLKGLIKINNIATLETLLLDKGPQLFVITWNEGTNCANTFGLAMFQKRLN